MRSIIFLLLLILECSCSSTNNTSTIPDRLNGTWIPTMQEMAGKELPKRVYEKEKLIIKGSSYTVVAESVDVGVLKYKKGKMDIYGKDGVNSGRHFTAIYKNEYGRLTICYDLSGNGYPQAFETNSKTTYFLSVYQRERHGY